MREDVNNKSLEGFLNWLQTRGADQTIFVKAMAKYCVDAKALYMAINDEMRIRLEGRYSVRSKFELARQKEFDNLLRIGYNYLTCDAEILKE